MTKRKSTQSAIDAAADAKRDPSDAERAAMDADRALYDTKPVRPAFHLDADGTTFALSSPHNDEKGQAYRFQIAFGTTSSDFVSEQMMKVV